MRKMIIVIPLLMGIFFLGNRCAPGHDTEGHGTHEEGLLDEIRAHQDAIVYDLDQINTLDTNSFIKVHASVPGVADFLTSKRAQNLLTFPCANCHSKSLKEMQANRLEGVRKAHWDIHLVHANENIMNCTTCHSEDNMNNLTSLTGKAIQINESFKLCGQCHSSQMKDWEGGAHGKELNGWAPPRIATTCVSCHNPHRPTFPKRFPARLNTNQLGEE